ncbi:hypothetical protein D3C80_1348000 [compost metagenome]
MPFHLDAGNRVIQAQHSGVQSLTIKFTQRADKFFRSPFRWTRAPAINLITHQRMRNVRHMHTDLVSTARFQTQTQTRMNAEMFHNAVMRYRGFPHRVH